MLFWVIQVLGIFALIFYALSFQMKIKEKLLIMQVISNVFTSIQYILVMALTGAIQTILGVLRGIVFYFYKKRGLNPNKIVLIIFELAIILGEALTWNNILRCFPLIGMTANLYGQWQNDMKWLRILAIVSAILWSIYAFYTEVYTAMPTEILKIVSSLIGLWRFKRLGKTQKG
jgi:hypothetical protein